MGDTKSTHKMEKILISFQRKKFSDKTCEYLCSKLDIEEDQDIIRDLTHLNSGQFKSLKVKPANILLKKILQAII